MRKASLEILEPPEEIETEWPETWGSVLEARGRGHLKSIDYSIVVYSPLGRSGKLSSRKVSMDLITKRPLLTMTRTSWMEWWHGNL